MPATSNHRSLHPCLVCNGFVPHTMDKVVGYGIGHRKLIVHQECFGAFKSSPLEFLPTGASESTRKQWKLHVLEKEQRRDEALQSRTAVADMPVTRVVASIEPFPPMETASMETEPDLRDAAIVATPQRGAQATEPAATQGEAVPETLSVKQVAKALKTTEGYVSRLLNHQPDFPKPVSTGPYEFDPGEIKKWDETHPLGEGGRRRLYETRKPQKNSSRVPGTVAFAGPTTRVTLEISTSDFQLAQKLADRLSEWGADVRPSQILVKALHKGLAG